MPTAIGGPVPSPLYSQLDTLGNVAALLILLFFAAGLFLFGLLIFTQLGLMSKTLITPAGRYFKLVSLGVCLLSGAVVAYIAFISQAK